MGDGIPAFERAVQREIWPRITRDQVVVLFGFFVAFCVIVALRIVLFEYFPSLLQSFCPMLTRLMQKTKVAKGIPNYFDGWLSRRCLLLVRWNTSRGETNRIGIAAFSTAVPTPILREKVNDPRVKSALRVKYRQALDKRESLENAAAGGSPKRRNRRSVSAAEQCSDAHWIVGCPSYGVYAHLSIGFRCGAWKC